MHGKKAGYGSAHRKYVDLMTTKDDEGLKNLNKYSGGKGGSYRSFNSTYGLWSENEFQSLSSGLRFDILEEANDRLFEYVDPIGFPINDPSKKYYETPQFETFKKKGWLMKNENAPGGYSIDDKKVNIYDPEFGESVFGIGEGDAERLKNVWDRHKSEVVEKDERRQEKVVSDWFTKRVSKWGQSKLEQYVKESGKDFLKKQYEGWKQTRTAEKPQKTPVQKRLDYWNQQRSKTLITDDVKSVNIPWTGILSTASRATGVMAGLELAQMNPFSPPKLGVGSEITPEMLKKYRPTANPHR